MSKRHAMYDEVEMHSAYMWDCNNCGTENFQRAVSVKLDPEDECDRETILGLYGEIVPGQLTMAQSYPEHVICRQCKTQFKAMARPDELGDEGDED